ncbi:hypothetical protein [Streptomyces scabiei]|uniref:hypothetical protein n=1 Tax=Streptomyces scabiei TaxID=1930 RepID=UPI001B34357B|nr:hypothetical protein [Streptomyces sp. LBUM 1488]MBP5904623.1 hypothetical protein [Streptomyces sp. LBUM 1488]
MPRTITAAPAERLTAVVADILGTDWTPPVSPDWPAVFTNEAAALELTLYPDRLNNRLVFILAPADDPDAFGRRRYAKYTPDLTGHDTIDGWLAHGDLTAVADALALILERLVEQPLPERTANTNPLEREREQLAKQAQELAAHAAQFAAGLVWSQPVADDASHLVSLAEQTAHTATRVDELRGSKSTRR